MCFVCHIVVDLTKVVQNHATDLNIRDIDNRLNGVDDMRGSPAKGFMSAVWEA